MDDRTPNLTLNLKPIRILVKILYMIHIFSKFEGNQMDQMITNPRTHPHIHPPYLQFQKLPLSHQAFIQSTVHAFKKAIVYSD